MSTAPASSALLPSVTRRNTSASARGTARSSSIASANASVHLPTGISPTRSAVRCRNASMRWYPATASSSALSEYSSIER
ncbi:Uncharacterised protein [Mycobacteroides abscessus subsp. abscessus]|nr:Uncharacterised protein [Mycobacteroides abscessus subsp. abscessus]